MLEEQEKQYYENIIKALQDIRQDIKELNERLDLNEKN